MFERQRFVAIDYLRGFVVLLVVLHHSVLAYYPQAPAAGAPFDQMPFAWGAFPVVDAQRSELFALLVPFNDIFFMALLFFVSGLFVADNLERKGALPFVAARFLRLGVPFVFAAAVIAPIAYYPAYLQSGAEPGLAPYWQSLIALPFWPAGPGWFLWVLLAFGTAAGFIHLIWPGWTAMLARLAAGADRHPWRFLLGLVGLSGAGYIALSMVVDPFRWLTFGPFALQASRIIHYAVYFLAGVAVGGFALGNGLLAADGKLARRWWLYASLAVPAFFAVIAVLVTAPKISLPPHSWEAIGGALFALSCGLSSFTLLALFVRFLRRPNPVLTSLARNSYGIYLVHYAFVSWAQWLLLPVQLGPLEKAAIVVVSAVGLSWATTAFLRRLPGARRVL